MRTDSFPGITDETVVATGLVIRYVDSPESAARGYDVEVRRWIKGTLVRMDAFLRVDRAVEGIRGGQPVMIIAEPGLRENVVVAGTCVPLVPISEDELDL